MEKVEIELICLHHRRANPTKNVRKRGSFFLETRHNQQQRKKWEELDLLVIGKYNAYSSDTFVPSPFIIIDTMYVKMQS